MFVTNQIRKKNFFFFFEGFFLFLLQENGQKVILEKIRCFMCFIFLM